jgi:hypothetical protein
MSTLAIYTAVSDDFANTMMRRAIDRAIAQDERHDRQGQAGRTKGSA